MKLLRPFHLLNLVLSVKRNRVNIIFTNSRITIRTIFVIKKNLILKLFFFFVQIKIKLKIFLYGQK
uniref:CSON014536 protein n=1 Tax=Culicoides sonorensis TaxID=179676 RepID=A0A336MF72_CULSO